MDLLTRPMSRAFLCLSVWLTAVACTAAEPAPSPLPNFDRREVLPRIASPLLMEHAAAEARLQALVPGTQVTREAVTGSPRWIASSRGFLTVSEVVPPVSSKAGQPRLPRDPDRVIKSFLTKHQRLFGHGPEALEAAVKKRDYVAAHNGVRTVVWQQQVDGIPVFAGVFKVQLAPRGELMNVSSQFLPDAVVAADAAHPNRQAFLRRPNFSAQAAVAKALDSIEEPVALDVIRLTESDVQAPHQPQRFKAGTLPGEARAELVWLPVEQARLRLCWMVEVTRRYRGETYRVLVDAETGETWMRHNRTFDLSDATYRVFTSDSPSPFSPAFSSPTTNQPPLVARSLVTWAALDTNASPIGWISDGDNETRGNNVDAHLDRNADNVPDLPRPHGSPFRVFDFPLDLTQGPETYRDAAVVQLFYWCNWMHDRLYELGFDEAAGNFQKDNFGRGGEPNDPVLADAQDGSGFNNANFTAARDGTSGRVQMFVFNGPTPFRDADLDAEVMCHEYTHGLTDRLAGGEYGIYQFQTYGLAEGWSDFYALALLSEPTDDVDGCYPVGGYMARLFGGLTENYYYGIRRYPVTTDMAKNPLTFKDIDPTQASFHPGIPRSPIATGSASESHRVGEVWCAMLWDARANLIHKLGYAEGNRLMLQYVTDGLSKAPSNPTFKEARDGILAAEFTLTHGVNRAELFAAFARRGLGKSAYAPENTTTTGVREDFESEPPQTLSLNPTNGFLSSGVMGGPFEPASKTYTLINNGSTSLRWAAGTAAEWLQVLPVAGVLAPLASNTVTLSLKPLATNLPSGMYAANVQITNLTSYQTLDPLPATLFVTSLEFRMTNFLTQRFRGNGDFDLSHTTLTFTPDTNLAPYHAYRVCAQSASAFPTDPSDAQVLSLVDDCYALVSLTNGAELSIFGRRTNEVLVGSNGDIVLEVPTNHNYQYDPATRLAVGPYFVPDDATYFERLRLAPLYVDLNPGMGGTISWKQMTNRLVVTYQDVPEFDRVNANSVQVEWFFDGTIRFTYLNIAPEVGWAYGTPKVGLAAGAGIPTGYLDSDFSQEGCFPPLLLVLPDLVKEGPGSDQTNIFVAIQPWPGTVLLGAPAQSNVTVTLHFSDRDPAVFAQPGSVVIPPGQISANFNFYVPNDGKLTGPRPLIITASADGYNDAQRQIQVQDAEVVDLTVNVPARMVESSGVVTGRVAISSAPDSPVVVNLSSSMPSLVSVDSSVIIPAHETSNTFFITIGDDNLITGPVIALITAHVPNWDWPDDIDAMVIVDNELTNLDLVLPSQVVENAGVITNGGYVYLSGYTLTNVPIVLTSEDSNLVVVPESITVPAGTNRVGFNLTIVDDGLLNGTRPVIVTANAPGFTSDLQTLKILDDESPSIPTNPTPAHLAAHVPTDQILQWEVNRSSNAQGLLVFDVYLGTNPVLGQADFAITTTNKTFTPPGLALGTTYFWQVVARVPTLSVTGAVWQFSTVALDHFTLSSVSSPQMVESPFSLSVLAVDDQGHPATAYNDTATLTALANADTASTVVIAEVDTGSSDRIEFLNVSRNEVNISGWQVVLYDWSTWPAPKVTYTIPFGSISFPGDLFQLRKSSAQLAPGAYPSLVFSNTLYWNNNPAGNPIAVLLLDSMSNIVDFVCAVDADPAQITEPFTIPASQWSGPPVPANQNPVWTYQRIGTSDGNRAPDWTSAANSIGKTNLGLTLPFLRLASLAIGPETVVFTNGIWSGSVTFHDITTNVFLRVTNSSGVMGTGNVFAVSASNNISLVLSVPSGRKTVGNPFDYLLTVTNTGPSAATGVLMLDTLPTDATFLSATSSLGQVSRIGDQLIFNLGILNGGSAATAVISVMPTTLGYLTNQATVWRVENEIYTNDNYAILGTLVGYPLLSIADAGLVEGNSGTTNLNFNLRLAEPSQNKVKVYFGTSDGTAVGGEDYQTTTGSVTFNPGETNQTILVPVYGDALYESNDTFFVNLSNAVNATIIRSQAVGTITNDDSLPGLTIANVSVLEGDDGDTSALFSLSLTAPSQKPSSVSYATSDGSATAGLDYVASSGRVTLLPGETNLTLTVPVIGNKLLQSNRTFLINLSVPVNTYFIRSQGVGTIIDDDAQQLHHFAWSSPSPTQFLSEPFFMQLTAYDGLNRPVTNFPGPVELSAGLSNRVSQSGTNTNPWAFPFGAYYHDSRIEVIYPSASLGGPGRLRGLDLEVAARPGQILSNWTVRLRHTTLNNYVVPAWETNWTVVHQTDLQLISTGWVSFHFQTPFEYNGQDNLMADFSFNNASFSSDGFARASISTNNQNRSLYFRTDSAFGDPLAWAGNASPTPLASTWYPNARFRLETPASVTPAMLTNFINGVWSGPITALSTGAFMRLQAFDDDGHSGTSDPFLVLVRDSDGDSMSDDWEVANQLDPLDPTDAAQDPDHDGLTNLQEYLAGTDPHNANSTVRIVGVTSAGAGYVRLSFLTVANRNYQLEYTSSFSGGLWKAAAGIYAGTGEVISLVVPQPPAGEQARFYRVRVLP